MGCSPLEVKVMPRGDLWKQALMCSPRLVPPSLLSGPHPRVGSHPCPAPSVRVSELFPLVCRAAGVRAPRPATAEVPGDSVLRGGVPGPSEAAQAHHCPRECLLTFG